MPSSSSRIEFSASGRRGPRGCCRGCAVPTCQMCLRGAKWLPVVFIVAIVSWSYYAYILHLCIFNVAMEGNYITAIILAVLYHIVLLPFLASYWQIVWTKPGLVPGSHHLSSHDIDVIESSSQPHMALETLIATKDLAVATRSMQGEIRYCSECSHIKPDRCHHCSVCNECVLKMDHHCPWVNNCVGFYNQKFFFLFLGYGFLYCIYIVLSTLKYFIAYWSHDSMNLSDGKFHVLFLFFVSAMFSISLLSLFGYHIYLISQNRTTLEAFRPPIFITGGANRKGFYLGAMNNIREVLGDQPLLWFVPVFSSLGEGLTFPRQCQMNEEDGYTSDHNRYSNSQNNRRFSNGNGPHRHAHADQDGITEEDDEEEEEELLLPKSKSWVEQDSAQAETSPDSLASGPSVTYEGIPESATRTTMLSFAES